MSYSRNQTYKKSYDFSPNQSPDSSRYPSPQHDRCAAGPDFSRSPSPQKQYNRRAASSFAVSTGRHQKQPQEQEKCLVAMLPMDQVMQLLGKSQRDERRERKPREQRAYEPTPNEIRYKELLDRREAESRQQEEELNQKFETILAQRDEAARRQLARERQLMQEASQGMFAQMKEEFEARMGAKDAEIRRMMAEQTEDFASRCAFEEQERLKQASVHRRGLAAVEKRVEEQSAAIAQNEQKLDGAMKQMQEMTASISAIVSCGRQLHETVESLRARNQAISQQIGQMGALRLDANASLGIEYTQAIKDGQLALKAQEGLSQMLVSASKLPQGSDQFRALITAAAMLFSQFRSSEEKFHTIFIKLTGRPNAHTPFTFPVSPAHSFGLFNPSESVSRMSTPVSSFTSDLLRIDDYQSPVATRPTGLGHVDARMHLADRDASSERSPQQQQHMDDLARLLAEKLRM